jgi:hypothetical protein
VNTINDIRKSVGESTPVLALVGATDAAVHGARFLITNASTVQAEVEARVAKLQEQVEKAVADFDAKQLQARVAQRLDRKSLQTAAQQFQTLAVSRALEFAGRAEAGYESLAERGKVVVERVRTQKATQDLVGQGKATVSRTRAAVTTARRAVDETATAALGAVRAGRSESAGSAATSGETDTATRESAGTAATAATKAATKRATATARKATSTRSTARGAGTGTRKTANGAAKAAEATADRSGQD